MYGQHYRFKKIANMGCILVSYDRFCKSFSEGYKIRHIHHIPGGLTKHLQPADVSWNKPFKQAYRTKYEEWLTSGDKTYTAAGNMRAPEKILCLQWVKESWNSLSTAVIMKSCGLSVNTDRSQDRTRVLLQLQSPKSKD